jgi:hypothetical protein
MGTRRLAVELSSIAREIDKATGKLKSIRSRVDVKARKKIDLDLKGLKECRKMLAKSCKGRSMSAIYLGPAHSGR